MENGWKKYWMLFKTTFVISACTFGGGAVIISMLQKEFVEKLHWVKEDEILDMVAIAQSSPGVMAVNTSIIIGYRVAGISGALLTVFGTVLPPMVILSVISVFYREFRDNMVVALLLRGMQAGVAAVMIDVTINMAKNVLKDKKLSALVLLIGATAATLIFQVDIILIILICGLIGGLLVWQEGREKGGAKK